MEQTVTKYYHVLGSAGYAGTDHENWVKVTGATEQQCEKEIEIQVAAEWEEIRDSYTHVRWCYETEEEGYQEAYDDALWDYEQDVECSYEDVTEYVEQNQPYHYHFNFSACYVDDWTEVNWVEI